MLLEDKTPRRKTFTVATPDGDTGGGKFSGRRIACKDKRAVDYFMLDKDNLERFFETPGLMATHLAVYTLLFLRSRFLDSNHLRVADASSLAREKIVKLVGIKKRRFEYILADMVNGDVLCRLGRGIYVFNPYIIHEGPDIWTARSAWKRLKAKDNAPDPFSAGLDNGDDDEGEKANHEAIAAERG